MKTGIIKAEDLPAGETVYLKKSNWYGWGVVHPWRNEDGSFNWFNFLTGGNWAKLITTIIIVGMICLMLLEYQSNLKVCLGWKEQLDMLQVVNWKN